jgi:hypothetical protein
LLVLKGLCRILIIVVVLSLACHTAEAKGHIPGVSVEGVERVTHLSTSGMNLWVEVANSSCWRMVVAEAEVDIFVGGTKRLTIALRDRVVVPRRATSEVLVPLRITSHSMFSLVSIIGRIAMGNREDITIDYSVRAGTPLFKRTLSQRGVPLDVLLQQLSLPDSEIGILKQLIN